MWHRFGISANCNTLHLNSKSIISVTTICRLFIGLFTICMRANYHHLVWLAFRLKRWWRGWLADYIVLSIVQHPRRPAAFRSFRRGYCSGCNKFYCLGLWNFFTRDYTLLLLLLPISPSLSPIHKAGYWNGYSVVIMANSESLVGIAAKDTHFAMRKKEDDPLQSSHLGEEEGVPDVLSLCTTTKPDWHFLQADFINDMINGTWLLLLLTCLWLCLIDVHFFYIIMHAKQWMWRRRYINSAI